MNIKSLSLKNKKIDNSGNEYFDLTAPSFIYDSDLGVKCLHYVLSDQVGRIDKISEIYFGTTEYIDAICVVNNIFNPFSIEEGDVLVIPNLSKPGLVYTRPPVEEAKKLGPLSNFIDEERQTQQDKNRIKRLTEKAKTKKSGVKNPLPPNMLQPNQSAKEFTGGNISLGSNLPSQTI